MKRLIGTFILLGASAGLFAQANAAISGKPSQAQPDGLLQSIENANFTPSGESSLVTRNNQAAPIEMIFKKCQGLGISREHNQWWILPISANGVHEQTNQTNQISHTNQIDANSALWILPLDANSKDRSWYLQLHGGDAIATQTDTGLRVILNTGSFTIFKSEARPHSDPFNHRFSLDIASRSQLEDALAAFYWGTMLPSVVEKTMAANFPYSSGYVLSTLKVSSYAGSYPAVDHEFQIKGRLAMASEADLDVVRRMIELQFKLMDDDPERLHRAPTSVQPNGMREYHVRRDSMDKRENAAMFPLTGNIEVIEEAWHYYEARKDAAWLRSNIDHLEQAVTWTLASVDQYGRVWSDVYYEDQVIKDGRETQAQAFAAYTFELLAKMEGILNRSKDADYYSGVSKNLAKALIEPLPMGYWDEKNNRFIDWIDRNGQVHDHIHLLANELPVLFEYATPTQSESVKHLIDTNDSQFERFPSFLSADIAAYDNSEIGNGGPYDLCAAGRYWFWDAAFRGSQNQNSILLNQLGAVATEGSKNNYFLGERYDMDYVYYIDGKNAHGAEKYYEYPNVYAAVLISKFLGLSIPADADVSVAPHLTSFGTIEFGTPQYALRYTYSKDSFILKNLSDKRRTFKVDLSSLADGKTHYLLSSESSGKPSIAPSSKSAIITLSPHEEARWVPTL